MSHPNYLGVICGFFAAMAIKNTKKCVLKVWTSLNQNIASNDKDLQIEQISIVRGWVQRMKKNYLSY